METDQHAPVHFRGSEAEDTGYGSDHDSVSPGQQGTGGRVPEPVDDLVDGTVFFNVGVGLGQICLRLIVVVIGDEIFHGVIREEALKLVKQLSCQGLVVRDDQGRTLDLFDDICQGKGLAGPGYSEKNLVLPPGKDPLLQLLDGSRLVTAGGIFGGEIEGHGYQLSVIG